MVTGSIEQQDLMVVIRPLPSYQIQIQPPDSSWYNLQIAPSEDRVFITPLTDQHRVTISPIQVKAVDNLSSYIRQAQFAVTSLSASYADYAEDAGRAVTASYADVSSGTVAQANFANTSSIAYTSSVAEVAEKVVFAHASGSIIYTGSLAEGIFGVSETVYTCTTSSYCSALVEYVAERANSIRVGQIMATWLDGTIKFTDLSTTDIGDANDISFNVVLNGGNVNFRVTSLGIGSGAWTVQTVFKLFPRLV